MLKDEAKSTKICSVAFNYGGDIVALGDSDGRVLTVSFIEPAALFESIDVIHDIKEAKHYKNEHTTGEKILDDKEWENHNGTFMEKTENLSSVCSLSFSPPVAENFKSQSKKRNGKFQTSTGFINGKPVVMQHLINNKKKNQIVQTGTVFLAVAIQTAVVLYDIECLSSPVAILLLHTYEISSLFWLPSRKDAPSTTAAHLLSVDKTELIFWDYKTFTPKYRILIKPLLLNHQPLKDILPITWPPNVSDHHVTSSSKPKRVRSLVALLSGSCFLSVWSFGDANETIMSLNTSHWLEALYRANSRMQSSKVKLHLTFLRTNRNFMVALSHPPYPYLISVGELQFTEESDHFVSYSVIFLISRTTQQPFKQSEVQAIILNNTLLDLQFFDCPNMSGPLQKCPTSSYNLKYLALLYKNSSIEIRNIETPNHALMVIPNSILSTPLNSSKHQLSSHQTIPIFEASKLIINFQSTYLVISGAHRGNRFFRLSTFLKSGERLSKQSYFQFDNNDTIKKKLHGTQRPDFLELQHQPALTVSSDLQESTEKNVKVDDENQDNANNEMEKYLTHLYGTSHLTDKSNKIETFLKNKDDSCINMNNKCQTQKSFEESISQTQHPKIDETPIPTLEIRILDIMMSAPLDILIPSSLLWIYTCRPTEEGWAQPENLKKHTIAKSMAKRIGISDPSLLSLHHIRTGMLQKRPYRFPDTQRQEAWTLLLRLPKHQEAYDVFLSEIEHAGGTHPFYDRLEQRLPLKDEMILKRLKHFLSAIAYWWPQSREVEWLPQLAFGLVSLFGGKPLFCFEVFLAMALWWSCLGCRCFNSLPFITIPLPILDPRTVPSNTTEQRQKRYCNLLFITTQSDDKSKKWFSQQSSSSQQYNSQFPEETENHSNNNGIITSVATATGEFILLDKANANEDLHQWAWPLQPLPGSPPICFLMLISSVFLKEDSRLWVHIVTHWGILTSKEATLILNSESDFENNNYNPLEVLLKQNNVQANTISTKKDIISPSQLHARVGSRILWPLIRSWLSEVLSSYHLATLWDHFFSNPMRPLLVPAAAISFLIVHRLTLMSLAGFQNYFTWMTGSRSVSMEPLLLLMYRIDADFSSVYFPALSPNFPRPYPPPVLSLTDLGWPLWYRPGESLEMSGVMYPELVPVVLPWTLNPKQVQQSSELLLSPSLLKMRRTTLLKELKEFNPKEHYEPYITPSTCETSMGQKPNPVLESLISYTREDEIRRSLDELAYEEKEFQEHVITPLSKTMTQSAFIGKELEMRQKLLTFYDECIERIQKAKRRNAMTYYEEKTRSNTCFDILNGIKETIPLTTAEEDWKMVQNALNENAEWTLDLERLAQRRRVIEEEARALLDRQNLISSSNDIPSQHTNYNNNNDLSSVVMNMAENDTNQFAPLSSSNSFLEPSITTKLNRSSSSVERNKDSLEDVMGSQVVIQSKTSSYSSSSSLQRSHSLPKLSSRKSLSDIGEVKIKPCMSHTNVHNLSSSSSSRMTNVTPIPSFEREALIAAVAKGRRRFTKFLRSKRRK